MEESEKIRRSAGRSLVIRSSPHASGARRVGQLAVGALTLLLFSPHSSSASLGENPIRVLLERPPATLDPRRAIDANAQKLGELLFGALTAIDADLRMVPGFADSWRETPDGKAWLFRVRAGITDSGGGAITPSALRECLENYRAGSPISPHRDSFPSWVGTRVEGGEVRFDLSAPDPSLPRNASLLRYFRQEGRPPCAPVDAKARMHSSGEYRLDSPWEIDPANAQEFALSPRSPGLSPLVFRVTRDESVRVMELLRGGADAALNVISLTKTAWLRDRKKFPVLEREGVAVSYLAFQGKSPPMDDARVRRAIALSIDREAVIRHKMFGFGSLAGSFLHPDLPGSLAVARSFDPSSAEKLLDAAGYARGKDGTRLRLRYLTTPVREGFEQALVVRDHLRRVGVEVQVEVVEPGIFLSQIGKKGIHLYSSRWIGVSDASIFRTTLRTGLPRNRIGYSDREMDRLLDEHAQARDAGKRDSLARAIQAKMGEDLPYFPLWFWRNAMILRPGVRGIDAKDLSMSGGFRPLGRLKR